MFGITYRPQRFSEVIGQDVIVKGIQKSLTNGYKGGVMAFLGCSGIGKSTLGRLTAKAMSCEHPIITENGYEPCCECSSCKNIENEVFTNGLTVLNGGDLLIDKVRKIEDDLKYESILSDKRIYLIEEAQLVPTNAFKEFLTMLESSKDDVVFILTSTDLEKFNNSYAKDNKSQEGNAFRSRLSVYKLKDISTDSISEYLFNILGKIDPDEKLPNEIVDVIPCIAEHSKNNVRQALNDFEQCVNCEIYTVDGAISLLNYVDEEKEAQVVVKMAYKDKSALEYIRDTNDLSGNVPYWYSIISSYALRDAIGKPFDSQWKEKSYQQLKASGNLMKLYDAFNNAQQLCMNYFNSNIFISCILKFYSENPNGITKVDVQQTSQPQQIVVKKIKKIV